MTPLVLLYLLGTVHACFAGYREAAGRNLRIRKTRYYVRGTVRGLLAGQVAAFLIGVTILLLAARLGSLEALYAAVERGAWAAVTVFGAYAALIALAFAFFAFPHPEVRTITSVLVFGPFTLGLKAVIVAGAAAAVAAQPRFEVAILFAVGAGMMLAVEPALARLGWSLREASLAPAEVPRS